MEDSIHGRLRGSLQNCKHKRSYRSYEKAVQAAIHYTEKFGAMQYVYYCSLCGRYHLTSHRQKEGRELEIYEARVRQELERRKQNEKQIQTKSEVHIGKEDDHASTIS